MELNTHLALGKRMLKEDSEEGRTVAGLANDKMPHVNSTCTDFSECKTIF
jgi:hypothetical protein